MVVILAAFLAIFVAGFFAYLRSLHYLTERGWISNERAKKLGL